MNPRRFPPALVPLLAGVLLVVFFSLLPAPEGGFFLTGGNFKFIAAESVVVAIGALGMTLLLAGGGIDLSAGAVIVLAGGFATWLMQAGYHPGLAVLGAVAAGAVAGAINGSLVSLLKAAPFAVTLGMFGVAGGGARWFAEATEGQAAAFPKTWIDGLMAPFPAHSWMILAPGIWIVLLLAGAIAAGLRHTVFGPHLFAVGSNEAAAALCGVRIALTKGLAYTVAGVLFGAAGVMQMAWLPHGGLPREAAGLDIEIIAAALLGGASLKGGTGSIFGSLCGTFALAVLRNGSHQAGWPPFVPEMLVGAALIVAVALDWLRCRGPREII